MQLGDTKKHLFIKSNYHAEKINYLISLIFCHYPDLPTHNFSWKYLINNSYNHY